MLVWVNCWSFIIFFFSGFSMVFIIFLVIFIFCFWVFVLFLVGLYILVFSLNEFWFKFRLMLGDLFIWGNFCGVLVYVVVLNESFSIGFSSYFFWFMFGEELLNRLEFVFESELFSLEDSLFIGLNRLFVVVELLFVFRNELLLTVCVEVVGVVVIIWVVFMDEFMFMSRVADWVGMFCIVRSGIWFNFRMFRIS